MSNPVRRKKRTDTLVHTLVFPPMHVMLLAFFIFYLESENYNTNKFCYATASYNTLYNVITRYITFNNKQKEVLTSSNNI